MTTNRADLPKDPLLRLVQPALKRAALRAREDALRHNTNLIIWQNNKLCQVSPRQIMEKTEKYSLKPDH